MYFIYQRLAESFARVRILSLIFMKSSPYRLGDSSTASITAREQQVPNKPSDLPNLSGIWTRANSPTCCFPVRSVPQREQILFISFVFMGHRLADARNKSTQISKRGNGYGDSHKSSNKIWVINTNPMSAFERGRDSIPERVIDYLSNPTHEVHIAVKFGFFYFTFI